MCFQAMPEKIDMFVDLFWPTETVEHLLAERVSRGT